MSERPTLLFIVGIGRSGTSLVQSMLASHSRIASPPETALVRRYLLSGRFGELYRDGGKKAIIDALTADSNVRRLGVDFVPVLEGISPPGEHAGGDTGFVRDLYHGLLGAWCGGAATEILCDKDPRLLERLDGVAAVFPDAFVLNVIRDPRDVLASKKKAAWSRHRPALLHIAAGMAQWTLGRRRSTRLADTHYRELRYEDLLEDPEATVRAVCDWLAIPFESGMLSFSGTAGELVSDDEWQWKKETLRPLMTDNSGKWRSELTPFEAAAASAGNRAIIEAGAYAQGARPAGGPLSARMAGTVCGLCMRLVAGTYVAVRILRNV